jgi:hypothetical protein
LLAKSETVHIGDDVPRRGLPFDGEPVGIRTRDLLIKR